MTAEPYLYVDPPIGFITTKIVFLV